MYKTSYDIPFEEVIKNCISITREEEDKLLGKENTLCYNGYKSLLIYNENCIDEPYNIIRYPIPAEFVPYAINMTIKPYTIVHGNVTFKLNGAPIYNYQCKNDFNYDINNYMGLGYVFTSQDDVLQDRFKNYWNTIPSNKIKNLSFEDIIDNYEPIESVHAK